VLSIAGGVLGVLLASWDAKPGGASSALLVKSAPGLAAGATDVAGSRFALVAVITTTFFLVWRPRSERSPECHRNPQRKPVAARCRVPAAAAFAVLWWSLKLHSQWCSLIWGWLMVRDPLAGLEPRKT